MSLQTTFDATFAGELIEPGDPGYDAARALFNGVHDKRPALIARCAGPEDVRVAIAYARERGLPIAVRGGGHSIPGHSSCDGGLVVDVGPMKHAEVDPVTRTGRFGGGLTWAELDAATQAHGLAVTGGRVSHTGVAGLTLGSGSGWLERLLGCTGQHLIGAEVVTADGRVVRASAEEEPELLWGLRGGGGNFGVVTELEFRLHPVGPLVLAGMVLHPREVAADLIRSYRDFMESAPDEVCGGLGLLTAPDGRPAAGLILLYAGDPAQGAEVLRPLLEWGDPSLSMVQPMPYAAAQAMTDPANPWGISEYFKIDYLADLPDDAIDALVAAAARMRSPHSAVYLCPLGGAYGRMDRAAMALEAPDAGWFYFCDALWWDPADGPYETAWARGLMEVMRPWGLDRALPNFVIPDEGERRLLAAYGPDKHARLVRLKDVYDPDNVFALNMNIRPSGRG